MVTQNCSAKKEKKQLLSFQAPPEWVRSEYEAKGVQVTADVYIEMTDSSVLYMREKITDIIFS